MAKYEIAHACGHTETRHVDGPGRDRNRKIAWLEGQDCSDCWRSKRDAAREVDRAVSHAKAVAQAAEKGLPTLVGTEKQIAWAETLRAQALERLDALRTRWTIGLAGHTGLDADEAGVLLDAALQGRDLAPLLAQRSDEGRRHALDADERSDAARWLALVARGVRVIERLSAELSATTEVRAFLDTRDAAAELDPQRGAGPDQLNRFLAACHATGLARDVAPMALDGEPESVAPAAVVLLAAEPPPADLGVELPGLEGSSDKQAAYADKVRGESIQLSLRTLFAEVPAGAERDAILVWMRRQAERETQAKIWLDLFSGLKFFEWARSRARLERSPIQFRAADGSGRTWPLYTPAYEVALTPAPTRKYLRSGEKVAVPAGVAEVRFGRSAYNRPARLSPDSLRDEKALLERSMGRRWVVVLPDSSTPEDVHGVVVTVAPATTVEVAS